MFIDRASTLDSHILLYSMEARPTLLDRIAEVRQDSDISALIYKYKSESHDDIEMRNFSIDIHGYLRKNNRLVVPSIPELTPNILTECHRSKYTIHPSNNKMYTDMYHLYYWKGMM